MSAHPASRAGAASVLAGAALFGTIGTARVLGPQAPSVSVGALRLILAAAALLLLTAPWAAGAVLRAWREPAVWLAAVAQAAFNVTFLAAVTRAGVAVGTLVAIGCTPILTGLLARLVSTQWAAATAVALVGLALLLTGDLEGGVSGPGVLFALGAAASYATFIVTSSSLAARGLPAGVVVCAVFTAAAVLLSPGLFVASLSWAASPGGLAMVGYLALVATVVAYRLFNAGLARVEPGTAATLGLVEPLVAAVLAVVLLDERLPARSWIGAATVLVALAVMVRFAADRPGAVRRPAEPVPARGEGARP